MNLALTDPFILAQDYPEALTGKLRKLTVTVAPAKSMLTAYLGSGHATCLRFNRRGDFLASGRVCVNVQVSRKSALKSRNRLTALS